MNNEGVGLYKTQCMLNHSCKPNARITYDNNHVLSGVRVYYYNIYLLRYFYQVKETLFWLFSRSFTVRVANCNLPSVGYKSSKFHIFLFNIKTIMFLLKRFGVYIP